MRAQLCIMLHAGAHDLDGVPGTLCIAANGWVWAVTSLLCYQHGPWAADIEPSFTCTSA